MCVCWHLAPHQSHDVIGQVPGQVRGHKTGKASQSDACVILVRTAEILVERNVENNITF